MPDAVSSTGDSGSVYYVRKETKQSGIKIDSEMFLKLLVAQVQYQDPLEPQSNTEFVSQLSQMNEVEQLQQMNSSLGNTQAYNLIGKYAYAEVLDSETGVKNQYFGLISSILIDSGTAYAVMDDKAISLSDITRIFDSSYVENATESTEDSSAETNSEADDNTAGV